MLSIVAQFSPPFSPTELFVGLGLVLTVLLGIVLFRQAFPGQNPPLHKTYVSRTAFQEHAQQVSAHQKLLADKVEKDTGNLAAKLEREITNERQARKEIDAQIAELQESVGVVRALNETQSEALADLKADQGKIRDRIDAVPERTINLLRNAGALK